MNNRSCKKWFASGVKYYIAMMQTKDGKRVFRLTDGKHIYKPIDGVKTRKRANKIVSKLLLTGG